MITVNIREEDEFIKLGQALKLADLVSEGVEKSRSCWFRCGCQNGYFRWAGFGKRSDRTSTRKKIT